MRYRRRMDLENAMQFVREHRNGVLTTIRRDGRPQLSNVLYSVTETGVVRISITADRAKAKNLKRDARAALYVGRDDFWAYVVIDGIAELSPVAQSPGDDTVDQLVEMYRLGSGEHPDWDQFRTAMVNDQR